MASRLPNSFRTILTIAQVPLNIIHRTTLSSAFLHRPRHRCHRMFSINSCVRPTIFFRKSSISCAPTSITISIIIIIPPSTNPFVTHRRQVRTPTISTTHPRHAWRIRPARRVRRPPGPLSYQSVLFLVAVPNSISSVINTPVTSPYSGAHPSRCSPLSDMGHNSSGPPSNMLSMQPSPPVFNPSSSSSNIAAPKKRILNLLKQEAQDELQTQQDGAAKQLSAIQDSSITAQEKPISRVADTASSSTLPILSDIDLLAVDRHKKLASGFLINTTPSSSSTGTHSSTSSSSSQTHFNYENLPGPTTNPVKAPETPSNSSFQWPVQNSQFRRQLSQNLGHQTPSIVPATPYTPPPMLSPYRKGPGLYYQIFSQPTPQIVTPAVATPFTPRVDDLSGPKINIGEDYQATIPQLQLKPENTDTGMISVGLHREIDQPSQL